MSLKLQPVEREAWQDFQKSMPLGSLFHRWEWQEIIEVGFGLRVNRLGLFDEMGALKGLLPLVERKMSLLKLAGSPLSGAATPHSGPLGDVSMADVLSALEEYASKNRLDYLELGLPEVMGKEDLEQNGYTVEQLTTLDLQIPNELEPLWAGLEVRCRNAIRKAEKSGVEVVEAQTLEEWLDLYYDLSCGVYHRQEKEPPFSKEYFTSLWQNLYPSGDLVVLLARYEGKIIAGGIFPRDRNVSYYLDGVSDREYNKVVPNNLIQWEYLKRAQALGIQLYDMVGANIPSIAKFKKSFGSTERNYLYAYRNRTIAAKVGRTVYAKHGETIKKFLKRS
ncbi:GNAT family N-acetyltransferase [Desulfosporosinus sp. BICA1-9]|uniref:lipid II:glycine glycyltransferase FemX n=1 Tax=Desulfosporosinus sp. BICA1-9 TaxID=1531958 RepID=UPI00054C3F86|nr:GNAT family N-acetyltransferase [Desulfosporosinus sp. BICA1-9]KJS78889.1 MAG: methicillin resistance protein [Desulfosporosinus sp. BICA1-9]HBW37899.1 peptidoglycan bridge formation glycyltransferase FemA/FemB family protein [Desulfosporosinus sp.]